MNINSEIIKAINSTLTTNFEFEFIAGLECITLADIEYIEKISNINNIELKINYQIVDNIYIKIDYSKLGNTNDEGKV